MTLLEEIKKIDTRPKKLREFGLLIGGIIGVLGGFALWRGRPIALPLLGISAFLVFCGGFAPGLLLWPYRIWMGLALVMGWVVSHVLLSVLYFGVITPLGVIARLCGKDFLDKKFPDTKASYWIRRSAGIGTKEDCEKQF